VTIALKDHEKLLTEVINEVNAMRNKYDAFSHFTESKIADYVNQRKQLNDRIEQLNDRIEQLNDRIEQLNDRIEQQIRDLAVTNAQRAQIQSELVNSTLLTDKFLAQRDKARSRVKFLEASRAYRLEQKLRSLVPKFFRSK
jgi:chromosome segregation ATPase